MSSVSQQAYSPDDLDRAVDAVLAAASQVAMVGDDFNAPNWNTGAAAASGLQYPQNPRSPAGPAVQQKISVSSQVTPRSPPNSGGRTRTQSMAQNVSGSGNMGSGSLSSRSALPRALASAPPSAAQPYAVDDDVDAITSAILQERYPQQHGGGGGGGGEYSYGNQSFGSRSGAAAREGSQQQQHQQQASPLDGTQYATATNSARAGHNLQSPMAQDPAANGGSSMQHQKQQQQQQQRRPAVRSGSGGNNNKEGSGSGVSGSGVRSPEENAALRAQNEFVVRRMELWQYKRDSERVQADYERQQREVTGCTFQPALDDARRQADMERLLTPSALYFGNHAWGFDGHVGRLEEARLRKEEKRLLDEQAFRVKGPAAAKYRAGARMTVPEPFEFAGLSGNVKRLEHHLMTCGRTNVGGSPGGPMLVASRRGAPVVPHQGVRAADVEQIAEERNRNRVETGPTVPSGAFSKHDAWKDIAHPM